MYLCLFLFVLYFFIRAIDINDWLFLARVRTNLNWWEFVLAQLLILISSLWTAITATTVLRFKLPMWVLLHFLAVILAYFSSIDSVLPGLDTATAWITRLTGTPAPAILSCWGSVSAIWWCWPCCASPRLLSMLSLRWWLLLAQLIIACIWRLRWPRNIILLALTLRALVILRCYIIHCNTYDVIYILRNSLSYCNGIYVIADILNLFFLTVKYCVIDNSCPIFAFILILFSYIFFRQLHCLNIIFLNHWRVKRLFWFNYLFLRILNFSFFFFFNLSIYILLLRFFKDVSYALPSLLFNLALQRWSRYEVSLWQVLYVLINLPSAYFVLQE